MVYLCKGFSDYLRGVICPDEIFRHFSTLVSESLLCTADSFESQKLAKRYAIPAVARVCTFVV